MTTTTLPAECASGATFSSVACRLAKLLQAVQTTADGPVESKLLVKVAAAQEAERIGKALKALAAYKNVLKTRAAKRALAADARSALAAPLATLRTDLKALSAKP